MLFSLIPIFSDSLIGKQIIYFDFTTNTFTNVKENIKKLKPKGKGSVLPL